MNPLSKDQVSGIADRILLMAGTYAVARGWISQHDMMQLVALAIAVGGAVYGWYVNREKALVQSAANIPGTTIVTTPELAAATPNETNIVSNTSKKVVPQ